MSKWGIGICLGLAVVAEACALQWPAYALLAGHIAGGLAMLPVRIGGSK